MLSWITRIPGISFSTGYWNFAHSHFLESKTVFVFSPVLLLLLRISSWAPMTTPAGPCWVTADSGQGRTHWSSAESLLHAVNTCNLGWLLGQHSSSALVIWLWGAALNYIKNPQVLLGPKETNLFFCSQLRSNLWLVCSISSSADISFHSQEALRFILALGTKIRGDFFLILHSLVIISDSSQNWSARYSRFFHFIVDLLSFQERTLPVS